MVYKTSKKHKGLKCFPGDRPLLFSFFMGAFFAAAKNRAIAAIPQPASGGLPVFPLYPLRSESNRRLLI
jgi:hypothetical protein